MNSLELQLMDKGLDVEYALTAMIGGEEVGRISSYSQEGLEEQFHKINSVLERKLNDQI